MTNTQILKQIGQENENRTNDGVVSWALLDRLTARIARREGRMKYRSTDRWARQASETRLPPAA